jgi:ABC-2 type transport system permease protein
MAPALEWISDVMPLSHAVDATTEVTRRADVTGQIVRDLAIVAGCAVLAPDAGAAALCRQTRWWVQGLWSLINGDA